MTKEDHSVRSDQDSELPDEAIVALCRIWGMVMAAVWSQP